MSRVHSTPAPESHPPLAPFSVYEDERRAPRPGPRTEGQAEPPPAKRSGSNSRSDVTATPSRSPSRPSADAEDGSPWRTVRTLRPGDAGTVKLQRSFGDRLVCVRYRRDPAGRRLVTVELVVADNTPAKAPHTLRPSAAPAPLPVPGSPPVPPMTAARGAEPGSSEPCAIVPGEDLSYPQRLELSRLDGEGVRYDPRRRRWQVPLTVARRMGISRLAIGWADDGNFSYAPGSERAAARSSSMGAANAPSSPGRAAPKVSSYTEGREAYPTENEKRDTTPRRPSSYPPPSGAPPWTNGRR